MKQNERLLVYAVTGFLAVILVIAVLFGPSGRDVAGATKPTATEAKGLGDLLGQKGSAAAGPSADAPTAGGAGAADVLPAPGEVARHQPLVAADPSAVAAELVAQQLGPSRRDRTVRLVRARAGDSLELLVRRWCGARDPFLDEAKALNEELTVLRVGQEVCVPWVEDADLLAILAANQPKTLVSTLEGTDSVGAPSPAGGMPGVGSLQSMLGGGSATAPVAGDVGGDPKPTFAEPGRVGAGAAPARAASEYTVKSGDSLWKIADRTYGRQLAARMVGEIRAANPGLDERLRVGQKLVLPQAP
jgi:nucleoid-associated protein YgaU